MWRVDVLGEARIDLVQDVLAVRQRPHLADGLISDAGNDAANVPHDRIDRLALGVPIGLGIRELEADGEALALLLIAHDVARRGIVRHVVDSGANVDDRLERDASLHLRRARH